MWLARWIYWTHFGPISVTIIVILCFKFSNVSAWTCQFYFFCSLPKVVRRRRQSATTTATSSCRPPTVSTQLCQKPAAFLLPMKTQITPIRGVPLLPPRHTALIPCLVQSCQRRSQRGRDLNMTMW
jgi:hypothetical protein